MAHRFKYGRSKGFAMLVLLVSAGGCARYHAQPLGLEAPESPPLTPVVFDDRDRLSPDEAALLAIANNPALRAARDRRGLAAAQVIQAGLLPNPTLTYDFKTPVGSDSAGRVNAFGFGLDWKLSELSGREARRDAAREHAAAVDLEVAWLEWQAAESAKRRTCRLALAGQKLALAAGAERAFAVYRRTVADGVEAGLVSRRELAAAACSFRHAQSRTLAARAEMEREQRALCRALGLSPDADIRVEEGLDPGIASLPPVPTLVAWAKTNRLDLCALRRGYQSSEAKVRAAVRGQFPKITLGLISARDTDNVRTLGAGIAIGFPLFDRNQGRIAEARAARQQLFDEYTARLFEMRADLAQLVTALAAVRREERVGDEALSGLRETETAYRRAWDEGRADAASYYHALEVLEDRQFAQWGVKERLVDLGIALEVATGRYGLVISQRTENEEVQP